MDDTRPPPFAPGELAVFLDVDGTLLAFEDHPDRVAADGELRDLLTGLGRRLDGALALVSGRTLADLDRIMAPLVLAAAGTHGAELRFPDGRRSMSDPGGVLDEPRTAIARFASDHGGLLVEQKPAAVTLHYRSAPSLAPAVAGLVDALVAGEPELMVQHGKCVAEIKLRSVSKGSAIATFMETEPFARRRPMFIGDDLTDEHGFRRVVDLGGIAVKVGPGETIAPNRLADVAAVRAFLATIASGGAV